MLPVLPKKAGPEYNMWGSDTERPQHTWVEYVHCEAQLLPNAAVQDVQQALSEKDG